MQGTAAGADEDELGVDPAVLAGPGVLQRQVPAAVGRLADPGDVVAVVDFDAVVPEVGGQLAGQCTEVDVGALGGAGGGDALLGVAALDDQRRPLGDLVVVLGVLHAAEQRVRLEGLVAGLQELGVVVADDEAHVRHGVDEALGGSDQVPVHQVGPELAGELELFVDEQCLGRADRTVFGCGGVVELTEGGVAGSGVVPRVGAFEAGLVQPLEQGDGPVRFQLLDERPERGAHDAAANQDDVGMLGLGNEGHDQSPIAAALAVTEYPRPADILKLARPVKALIAPS